METLSTKDAAELIGISISHVQHLCKAYITTKTGLRCKQIGVGPRSSYVIKRRDAEAYRDAARQPGWPKGRARKESKSF